MEVKGNGIRQVIAGKMASALSDRVQRESPVASGNERLADTPKTLPRRARSLHTGEPGRFGRLLPPSP